MIRQWQQEHREWAARNFPDETLDQDLHGVMEEIGELAHAHLKAAQGIRGTREEHEAAAKDAVGDALVYLMGVCDHCGIDLQELSENTKPVVLADDTRALHRIGAMFGILLDSRLWVMDGVPKYTETEMKGPIARFYRSLETYCILQGWDMLTILEQTWLQVRKRDWVTHPVDADQHTTDVEVQ